MPKPIVAHQRKGALSYPQAQENYLSLRLLFIIRGSLGQLVLFHVKRYADRAYWQHALASSAKPSYVPSGMVGTFLGERSMSTHCFCIWALSIVNRSHMLML